MQSLILQRFGVQSTHLQAEGEQHPNQEARQGAGSAMRRRSPWQASCQQEEGSGNLASNAAAEGRGRAGASIGQSSSKSKQHKQHL